MNNATSFSGNSGILKRQVSVELHENGYYVSCGDKRNGPSTFREFNHPKFDEKIAAEFGCEIKEVFKARLDAQKLPAVGGPVRYDCSNCGKQSNCLSRSSGPQPVLCVDFEPEKAFKLIDVKHAGNPNPELAGLAESPVWRAVSEDPHPTMAMRGQIPVFTSSHVWSLAQQQLTSHGDKRQTKIIWSLYKLRENDRVPPVAVFDANSQLSHKPRQVALVNIESKELKSRLAEIPSAIRGKLVEVAKEWGAIVDEKTDLSRLLDQLKIAYEVVPRLRDPTIITRIRWPEFLMELVAYQADKDLDIALIHKSALLTVPIARYRPNRLEFTNSQVGKSEFYDTVGKCYAKATAKSLLGFAKSPDEIYPGTVSGAQHPIALDQIESHSAHAIMAYLFNVTAKGVGWVSAGAVEFPIYSDAIFAVLGNPIGAQSDPAKSFAVMLEHASPNPALGSRFGLILQGSDFKRIKPRGKKTGWPEFIELLWALEEYATPKLRTFWESEDTFNWLEEPIPKYEETIRAIVDKLDSARPELETARGFLVEHARGAQARIRGAALNCALLDSLPEIILDQSDPKEIREAADEYVLAFFEINEKSIREIAESFERELTAHAQMFYLNLPLYLKEVVSAVELYRRAKPTQTTIHLSHIPFEPEDERYWSKALDKLQRKKRTEDLFSKLERLFGFVIKPVNGDFEVFLTDLEPRKDIEPVGCLSQISPISPFLQSFGQEKETGVVEGNVRNTGEIEKTEKTEKQPRLAGLAPLAPSMPGPVKGVQPVTVLKYTLEVHNELLAFVAKNTDAEGIVDQSKLEGKLRDLGLDPEQTTQQWIENGWLFKPGDGTLRRSH